MMENQFPNQQVQFTGEGANGPTRVINRTQTVEVPHACNYHTHIINTCVRRHVYYPVYTCSEENRVCDVWENCCPGANQPF